jgi:hypothetical protein
MDTTQPIYIGCHIGVHLDVFVMSVKIDARKIFNRFEVPPLCMVIVNKFSHHRISDQKQIQSP